MSNPDRFAQLGLDRTQLSDRQAEQILALDDEEWNMLLHLKDRLDDGLDVEGHEDMIGGGAVW
ncbi:hypothetical protein L0U85_15070 [Glycomyces sp. L485]|uniref:aroma-sacti cluster domain-containing protein n=1 Tax=Glycomyces sp. L485 TaxID=2909235 RepID=UPI001F4A7C22|nr:aroma-sacti cluster domain-containing protein [Glycomyces sp. L485]MCH7232168.1 hypothetical protein [Glycomyces sp. L485]